jgi:hypothetical protein
MACDSTVIKSLWSWVTGGLYLDLAVLYFQLVVDVTALHMQKGWDGEIIWKPHLLLLLMNHPTRCSLANLLPQTGVFQPAPSIAEKKWSRKKKIQEMKEDKQMQVCNSVAVGCSSNHVLWAQRWAGYILIFGE